jgi:PBP1b-binding outer membrane lipoprotein LpoB
VFKIAKSLMPVTVMLLSMLLVACSSPETTPANRYTAPANPTAKTDQVNELLNNLVVAKFNKVELDLLVTETTFLTEIKTNTTVLLPKKTGF